MDIEKKLKPYFLQIKFLLPIYGRQERKFIRDLRTNIEEYRESHPDCTWDELINEFETPQEIVNNYLSAFSPEYLCKKIKRKKIMRAVLSIIIISFTVFLSIKTYYCYIECQLIRENSVTQVVTVIE